MPEKLVITAQVPANKEKGTPQLGPATITVLTGKDAKESIEMFGDAAVKSNSDANWTVALQGNIRSGLKKGETQEQMQARLGGAKMGVAQKGVKIDPVQAHIAYLKTLTPEALEKEIANLRKQAAAK